MISLGTLKTTVAAALLALPMAQSAIAGSHGATSAEDLLTLSTMKLLPGWLRDDGFYIAAIQIDMQPGWKTYWRAPGMGGIAPEFDWSGSRNLEQVGYFWPTPEVHDAYGARTIGYADRLVLPILLKPTDENKNIAARLRMDYGVCDDICVPISADDSAELGMTAIANRDLIGTAVSRRPQSGRAAGLTATKCELRPDGEDYVLTASFDFSGPTASLRAVVIETGSDTVFASDTDHRRVGNAVHVEADLRNYGAGALQLDRSALRFTLIGTDEAIDIQGCTGG